jgi:photosystem II stability/assembly factor-like uncharacterized protein
MLSVMNRRKYLVLLFAGILSIGTSQSQWNIEKCPTINNLNAISFTDLNSGWIVGEKGTMLYKSGNVWKVYQEFTSENLNSVFMIDKNNGWAVGDNGTIIHYNGEDWEYYDSPTKNDLFSVCFQDSEKGIAVGNFGTILIYKSGDWNLSENGIRGDLYSVFYKKDEAWLGGGLECINVPLIKMEMNKNENLFINSFDPYATIKSIFFLSPEDGWAVGSPSILLHFDGNQWERTSTNDNYSSLNSVFFSDENNGISVGFGGTVMIYSNNVWSKEITMTNHNLKGAAIIKNKYFAVGDSGTIIHIDLASENIANDINNNHEKIQVYPNPCDELLNVVIPCDYDDSGVSMSVYNLLGKIIMQKELRLSTRSTTYPLITRDLKNGLYMIRITIGDKIIINRFIISH